MREQFDVYLEASGPGAHAQRFRGGVGEEAFAAARSTWSGRVHGPAVTPSAVTDALGPADRITRDTLSYALPHRPGYLYEFRFDPSRNGLQSSGFVRLGPAPDLPRPPGTAAEGPSFVARLASAGVTADELRALLGGPADVSGWWPTETWEYPGGLAFDLRHEVVEEPTRGLVRTWISSD